MHFPMNNINLKDAELDTQVSHDDALTHQLTKVTRKKWKNIIQLK